MYLIPQALVFAVPVGLALGVLYGFGGRVVSRRLTGAVLAIAIVSSLASFGNVGWIVPAANQAFRVSAVGGNPMKGMKTVSVRSQG